MTKQVIVMRKDLNMRKGKMIAQGAHASMAVILNLMKGQKFYGDDNEFISYEKTLRLDESGPLTDWIDGNFKKICLSVDSESHLLELHMMAMNAGLLCSLIQDSGLTEFGGVPTFTCIAIGPAKDEDIDKITGGLKLL